MILVPLIVSQVIVAQTFFGNHWDKVHSAMARSLSGEITTMMNLVQSGNLPAVKTMAADTGINVSINDKLNRPKKNDNSRMEVGKLSQYLRSQIKTPVNIYIDRGNRLLFVDIPGNDGKIITFASSLRRVYSTSTEVFLIWLFGSILIAAILITPFIISHSRSITRVARAANRFGRGLDMLNFRPSGSREIRDASNALITMKERLDRYNATRTNMLNAVSHDLKSPLTRMRLALETGAADQDAMLRDIDRMTEMVNGYLAFARGEMPEIEQEVSLPPMLTRIARDETKDKKIKLTLNLPETPALFYARPLSLARAFQNLIENAARHAKSKINITEHDDGEILEVLIDDDGPGIPQDKRAAVMQPFVRLDESRGAATGGSGLGLSIAQTAIENHGGTIELLTSPIGGLRVRVVLPV
ncbi:MAG: hypothetical protein LBO08_02085 [Rickettsiales bacterium]|jgi:two-component system osmolarity sensor histidine kinase EnvZ|nr:hypothetical protein [Rickettsiales bacterium]